MTLRFHALLTADGKQAEAEVKKTSAAVDKLTTETRELSRESGSAAGALNKIEGEARQTARALTNTSTAARGVQQTHTLAAGSVGNLTAQFNDIGVMMAAGQNPLQMALQQGTQITQVFGPMGAGQAVKALRAAFVSMISPINLITIGSIAAGAALVQWLMNGREEAKSYEDSLDDLRAAVEAYTKASDLAGSSTRDLEERFGSAAGTMRSTLELLEQIAASEAQRQIDGINQSISELMGIRGDGDLRGGIADFFDVNIFLAFTDAQREAREEARVLTAEFLTQQDVLRQSAGDIDAQINALQELLDTARALAEASGDVNAEEEALLKNLAETLLLMQEKRGEADGLATSLDGAKTAALGILNAATGIDFSNAAASAGILEGKLARAWQFAIGIANNLATQAKATASLEYADLAAGAAAYGGAQTSMREVTSQQVYSVDGRLPSVSLPDAPRATGRGRGGSRATAAREERDAIADLIGRYEEQLALLQETDPVQQEMIRNREALQDATAAERAQVENLITTIEAEEQAKQNAAEAGDFLRDTAADVIPALIGGGDEAASAWQRFTRQIEDAIYQLLIVQPLMNALNVGGQSGGSGAMSLVSWVGSLLGFAGGGMLYGKGGTRDDAQLVWKSPGEFTVNADATAKHRALLEAINSNAPLPGFARGGTLGGAVAGSQTIINQFVDQTSGGVAMTATEEQQPDGTRLLRYELSDRVADAMSMPGGAARRTLGRQYGLTPVRPLR